MRRGAIEYNPAFVSHNSIWKGGHAIRGGVPISFPWFADKPDDRSAPPHGFVHTKAWRLSSIDNTGPVAVVSMSTEGDEDTRKWWPFDFCLVCQATFGIQLKIELTATNTGAASFSFEEALHPYFRVGDAETAFVQGLDATRYIDKTDRRIEKKQIGEARISSETDSVYLNMQHELELIDPTRIRSLVYARWITDRVRSLRSGTGEESIWSMDRVGNDRQAIRTCCFDPNVSPNGRKLSFLRSTNVPGESALFVSGIRGRFILATSAP